jgi:hypothetical protein
VYLLLGFALRRKYTLSFSSKTTNLHKRSYATALQADVEAITSGELLRLNAWKASEQYKFYAEAMLGSPSSDSDGKITRAVPHQ